ncbi:MAG TPA: hypothetical protein VJA19_20195 [Pseudomonas sp.]|nr:hypothetical protein [Pseudomonas sp.]
MDIFRRHFADFTDRYVLIGGVAATLAMEEVGLDFRATKDLDLVLIVEALDVRFAEQFWRFVEAGGYEVREKGGRPPQFYRFQKPADPSYPVMLELFSRAPDGLPLHEGAQLTPVPVDDAVSSLSAILLDEQYYRFILAGRQTADEITWLNAEHLIPLKASAWLDLSARQRAGEPIDSRNVRKHLNDVLRLSQLLSPALAIALPEKVALQMNEFLQQLPANAPDLKGLGMERGSTLPLVIERLRKIYALAE